MKKAFALFLSFFTLPAMASGIDATSASAPCTNNTLETYSGNTNLQADWQPNTIDIRWYNMNTQVTPTNAIANTCVYDGTLSIPSNAPSRIGYTFAGWEVRPQYDFSTLPANKQGIHAWSKNQSVCLYGDLSRTTGTPCDNGSFDDLNIYEWKGSFDYGMLYGMVKCTSTPESTIGKIGTPDTTTDGVYCWCKATGFIPTNSNIKYSPSKSPRWTYIRTFTYVHECHNYCADWCSFYSINNTNVRTAFFY